MTNPIPGADSADAYNGGLEAAQCGQSAATCPYEYSSKEGEQWLAGHQDGGGDGDAEDEDE